MASIKIPRNFDEQTKLFSLILEKHKEDGDSSPLQDYDLQMLEENTSKAVESDKKSKELARLSQEHTQARNLNFDPVEASIKDIAAFLKAKYRNNPKELGKWGFTVVGD